ncbi:MAG: hypothetical protein V4621_03920 [Pseudomonadota bacterium]
MKIHYVTMTGADDSVRPENLAIISTIYPRSEWGVLFYDGRTAAPRYPSEIWIRAFANAARQHKMNASAHLCGQHVADLLNNADFSWKRKYAGIQSAFKRVQLNFKGQNLTPHPDFFTILKAEGKDRTFIFQLDGRSDFLLHQALSLGINAVGLHDLSGRKGVLPTTWPAPQPAARLSGFSGGLTPANLPCELERIYSVAAGQAVWVDGETGLRNVNDQDQFCYIQARQFTGHVHRYAAPA